MSNEKQPSLDELILIMNAHPDREIRIKAGYKVINKSAFECKFDIPMKISQDKNFPESLRMKAREMIKTKGNEIIESRNFYGDCDAIMYVYENQNFPESLRMKAREMIERNVERVLNRPEPSPLKNVHQYYSEIIIKISQDKNFPESLRIKGKKELKKYASELSSEYNL